MVDLLILLAVIVVIVALVIVLGRFGGPGVTGPDDHRDDVPPSPGGQGR